MSHTHPPPSSQSLIKGLILHDVVWSGVDLSECAFIECAFTDADLSGADLREAQFKHCQLVRCNFAQIDGREARFDHCLLADAATQNGANFAFARMEKAQFTDCDLTHARFEGADLYDADFTDCRLLGAKFGRARFYRTFGRTVVRTAGAFKRSNLELADVSELNLEGCDLTGARLRETDLSGANLTGACLRDVDLFGAVIDGARFAGADLRGADLSGLDLRCLATHQNMKITPDQQFQLLDAMGVDVVAE